MSYSIDDLEIVHSKIILGGLVPPQLPGWYVIRSDGELSGPFSEAMAAVAFADQYADGTVAWSTPSN